MSPSVSIIIPSYNAASTVEAALDAACSQTWRELEVILVDDGSVDATADIAEAYPDERVRVIRTRQGGACKARNIGIDAAKGDYLQFLDADDVMKRDKIELQLRALMERGDALSIAYGPWHQFGDSPECAGVGLLDGRSYSKPMEWLFASMEEGFYTPPHCWLTPATVVQRAGHWDERLKQNQDGEFFARVLSVASEVIWVPFSSSYYRRLSNDSISQRQGRDRFESLVLAADLIRDRMLEYLGDDSARRSVISMLYFRILYRSGNLGVAERNLIWGRIQQLGLPSRRFELGGDKFGKLKKWAGWRLAFGLRSLVNK